MTVSITMQILNILLAPGLSFLCAMQLGLLMLTLLAKANQRKTNKQKQTTSVRPSKDVSLDSSISLEDVRFKLPAIN